MSPDFLAAVMDALMPGDTVLPSAARIGLALDL